MNDLLRWLMMLSLRPLAALFRWRFRRRIRGYRAEQAALRARYGVTDDTPVRV